jgi:hypothetical protein
MKIEYKIRPVTRYVVTRYDEQEMVAGRFSGGCTTQGEYDNADLAYEVAYALAKEQARILNLPPGDMTVIFPKPIGKNYNLGGTHGDYPGPR